VTPKRPIRRLGRSGVLVLTAFLLVPLGAYVAWEVSAAASGCNTLLIHRTSQPAMENIHCLGLVGWASLGGVVGLVAAIVASVILRPQTTCPACRQRTAAGSVCQWCDQPLGGEGG
jgi:hypothetical protein